MPAKGSVLLYGDRDYIFSPKFHKENLVKGKNVDLSYKECKEIIEHSNKIIADVIQDEVDGFKLPFGFGYVCPMKYEATYPAINWKESERIGKTVYHTNMHTEGFSVKIQWFRVGRIDNVHFNEVFKFKAYKTLSQKISKAFSKGKPYVDWKMGDFISKGKLENLYNKKFRKELKS
jgi:hypothetical protein